MWSADLGIQTNCKCMLNLSQSSVLWVSAIAIIAMSMSNCSRHKKMKLMLNLRFKAKSLEIQMSVLHGWWVFEQSFFHLTWFCVLDLVSIGLTWLMLHIWQQFYLDDLFTPILLHVDIFTSWRLARYEKESEVSDLPFIRSVIGTALNSRTLTLMASWNKLMKNFFMS